MNFYEVSFVFLASTCAFLSWRQYYTGAKSPEKKALDQPTISPRAKAEASQSTRLFLTVYCLVMASDWLQGPYVYSLYKDQFGLKETTVAALFTTGFLSGGISGYFVGQFADEFGRKKACLVFCVTYSIACFSTFASSVPLLFVGRIFGGLSTSLMYSAFESWMVTEYHKRQLEKAGINLSGMYGLMTTLNSVVAILSGVSSEKLVSITGTMRAPFMASSGLLAIAFWIILGSWTENYGSSHTSPTSKPSSPTTKPSSHPTKSKSALKTVLTDPRILTLGLASCFFEGSMYLFVFFWSPALKAVSSTPNTLPFGTIFASFMCSVMLGSLFFTYLTTPSASHSPKSLTPLTPSQLLPPLFAIASSSLLLPTITISEPLTFASFCLFEACVGMYWPSVGYLKTKQIEDGMRARIYGMLRIPLNVFVVVALGCMGEGEGYRNMVWVGCSGLLVFISGVFQFGVGVGVE